MSDVVGITADLTATEGLVARDAVIADLQTKVATLTAELSARDEQIAMFMASTAAGGSVANQLPVPDGTPMQIRLTSPYGYIDANGQNRAWLAGTVIKDRQEIALLVARKADHVVTEAAPPPAEPPAA